MARPFLIMTLCLAGGIVLSRWLAVPWPFWMGTAWSAGLLALLWSRRRPQFLPVLLVLTGAALQAWHAQIHSPHDLRLAVPSDPVMAEIRGRLLAPPREKIASSLEPERIRSTAVVVVADWRTDDGAWQPVRGRVLVQTPGMLGDSWHAGQRVAIRGILKSPPTASVPGLFDYENYLRAKRIHHVLQTEGSADWQALSSSTQTLWAWPGRFSRWARDHLARGLPEEDEALRLLWAMTLGWKAGLTEEVSEPFMQSGTLHVFAISGLHVALLASCLTSLLRLGQVPRGACVWVVLPALWFYTAATGWPASAIRASVMMSVILIGWSLHRPADLLNSLAAAAFLILLADPLQLFQAGFQLSFSVMLALALFDPVKNRLRGRWAAPDPWLPRGRKSWWRSQCSAAARYITTAAVASAAAWLGSLPLVAIYFHYLTPVSLLVNLIMLPLAGLALTSALSSLALGAWWSGLAELFNHSAWFWMTLMVWTSTTASNLPGAWFHIASPSLCLLLLYYFLLITLSTGAWRSSRRRSWLVAAACLLGGAAWTQHLASRNATVLSFLPAAGGSAVLVDGPDRSERMLVDGGREEVMRFTTLPFLRARGINSLPTLVLTHGDLNHVGGATLLLERYEPVQIVAGVTPFRSQAYRQLIQQLSNEGRLAEKAPGETVGPWRVLHPVNESPRGPADDRSLVLYGDFAGFRVLLLGDLGFPGQDELLNRQPRLQADLVVSGLPSQGEPLAEGFLAAVQPWLVVICDDVYPATQRVGQALRDRLAKHQMTTLCLSDHGAFQVVLQPGKAVVKAGRNRKEIARYEY